MHRSHLQRQCCAIRDQEPSTSGADVPSMSGMFMEPPLLCIVSTSLKRADLAKCFLLSKTLYQAFRQELLALKLCSWLRLCRTLGSRRSVAAHLIAKWWFNVGRSRWLNRVAYEAVRLHAFPHRTVTNYLPWKDHFRGGILAIDRIHATKDFASPRDSLECPVCRSAFIDTAVYTQIGEKMAQSTPRVDVGCGNCLLVLREREWSYADRALYTTLGRFRCGGEATWIRVES